MSRRLSIAAAVDGLSARLAQVVGAELLDLASGTVRTDHACTCASCRAAKAVLRDLPAPSLAAHTNALIRHAVALRKALWRCYALACRRPWTSSLDRLMDAAVTECQRLEDELGIPSADVVRRLTLKDFGERTGQWPFCATGQHPAGCSCPPDEVQADRLELDARRERGGWA
jgi:hypothetical protein